MNIKRAISLAIGVLTVFAIVAGFRLIGSPEHRHRVDLDNIRIAELQSIVVNIGTGDNAVAPQTLPAYIKRQYYPGVTDEPGTVSTGDYAFRRLDAHRYELCATFLEDSSDTEAATDYPHGRGRACYRYKLGDSSPQLPQPVTSVNAGRKVTHFARESPV